MAACTRRRPAAAIIATGLLLGLLAVNLQGVQGEELEKVPSEDQCRPYIEKALKDLGTEGSAEELLLPSSPADAGGDDEATAGDPLDDDGERGGQGDGENDQLLDADTNDLDHESKSREKRNVSAEEMSDDENQVDRVEQQDTVEVTSVEEGENEQESESKEKDEQESESKEKDELENESKEKDELKNESKEKDELENESKEKDEQENESKEKDEQSTESKTEDEQASVHEDAEGQEQKEDDGDGKSEEEEENKAVHDNENNETEPSEEATSKEASGSSGGDDNDDDDEVTAVDEFVQNDDSVMTKEEAVSDEQTVDENRDQKSAEEEEVEAVVAEKSDEQAPASLDVDESKETVAAATTVEDDQVNSQKQEEGGGDQEEEENGDESATASPEEEELIMEIVIPEILRPRDHIGQLLKLDEENEEKEKAVEKIAEVVLRDLKRLYDNAIKPLETLYKYRDLSNRHFGDPEIFSKPLVLFMGPWSGGKSSIINYLLDIEYKPTSLRTGAEPSPAYFNILMHGEEEEVLDGTQLAADWTFSGLQKFGQGLLDRLKGYKLNSKLLEKVNIVEIPGILEIRKQVQRLFPFNDACQWFIDRADIIFLVYDPSKLDVGPETEAILDQLKGREYQTRIILNKADQVKPEELMRVQGALIWNISPLMSSAEPPIMYSASLWSIPYEAGAPTRLLYAQERAFLRDLRSAIDKRVEHKIASARRFAVRVRNHAKMVDCYLTTFYNHKSFFAKKKDVADRIIESPQDYHIYEGLSTLTNISRYDLPDPDVYRDFFRLNNLYEFPLLSSTCTYFRGCPINRLDVAIAYDLPELVGKYKKSAEAAQAPPREQQLAEETRQASQQAQKAKSDASKVTLS